MVSQCIVSQDLKFTSYLLRKKFKYTCSWIYFLGKGLGKSVINSIHLWLIKQVLKQNPLTSRNLFSHQLGDNIIYYPNQDILIMQDGTVNYYSGKTSKNTNCSRHLYPFRKQETYTRWSQRFLLVSHSIKKKIEEFP